MGALLIYLGMRPHLRANTEVARYTRLPFSSSL